MNAKKIMGAVLVALLAAALFVGAASAADGKNYGPVFAYQDVSGFGIPQGVWSMADGTTITINTDDEVMPNGNFIAGTYTKGADTLDVFKPTVTYSALGTVNTINYIVGNNGIVYNGTDSLFDVTPTPLNNTGIGGDFTAKIKYQVTYPNGSVIASAAGTNPFSSFDVDNAVIGGEKGTYKVQAFFDKTSFADGIPFDLLLDDNVFTFTIVDDDATTISASVDTAFSGEAVTITVVGAPGAEFQLKVQGIDIAASQIYQITGTASPYTIKLENNGKGIYTGLVNSSTAKDGKYATLELVGVKDSKVEIKVSSPVVSAALEQESYFLGDTIKITGTATSAATLNFSIKGTNYDTQYFTLSGYKAGKTWEGELDTKNLPKLDVGTYSIIIKQDGKEVATLPVSLKQPFITLVTAPEVVIKGTVAEFTGTAEATDKVYYYVFGTNYFNAAEVGSVDFDENEFTFEIDEATTTNMSAGQYFVVIQHPMYDDFFNIAPNYTAGKLEGGIMLNTTGSALVDGSELFNVYDRQTANAAQALCDALDSQNIDDMYVKYAFIVAGEDESFTVSEIPSEITQGSTFTVSGTATASAGKYVTVEMISTAFAAVPKETVGSASFIALSTKVAEDGTWEVTFDTSNLNVDEYSVKVACENDTWKNVKVNVVEAADKPDTPDTPDVPDTPDTPDTPTEPETPGFGALAALAGLGAVAVLLLRRE